MSLSEEQARVLELIATGRNVFMTGGGGVGKSHVIQAVVEQERAKGRQVSVTASTGVAADQIGGSTLHSFVGLGLAKDPIDKLLHQAHKSSKVGSRWRQVQLLIIDEVSMLDPDFFDAVDKVARSLRHSPDTPFGGVQLLLVGDFFQLPPVHPKGRDASLPTFCFQTSAWREAVHEVVELTHIFRQEGDCLLSSLLQRARRGEYDVHDVDVLMSRVGVTLDMNGIEPTRMHARRVNVDEINEQSLAALGDVPTESFRANVYWELDPVAGGRKLPPPIKKLKTDALAKAAQSVSSHAAVASDITLKVGAQVMLLCNMDVQNGLVNGSRGVVTRFAASAGTGRMMPVVKFAKSEVLVERNVWEHRVEDAGTVFFRQVPLQLAWAVTIHKAQGLSLDCVEIQLDKSVFEFGQAYVALSRVRSLPGLKLLSFTPSVLVAHPLVKAFYSSLSASSDASASSSSAVTLNVIPPSPPPAPAGNPCGENPGGTPAPASGEPREKKARVLLF
jgi:ATP-dependent DNA helicase PIF1